MVILGTEQTLSLGVFKMLLYVCTTQTTLSSALLTLHHFVIVFLFRTTVGNSETEKSHGIFILTYDVYKFGGGAPSPKWSG
jgi:hypothetical protein